MLNKIYGNYSVQGVAKTGRKGAFVSEDYEAASDELTVSPFAKEMAALAAQMRSIPDIRTDKVEPLKEQVQTGAYMPGSMNVAAKLVQAGILNL